MGIHTYPYIYCNMITSPKTVAQGETTGTWSGNGSPPLSQIASDLRSAIPITNRNRSQIAQFGALRLGLSRRNSGKTPESLSEHFLEFPSRGRLGSLKPYISLLFGPIIQGIWGSQSISRILSASVRLRTLLFSKCFQRGPELVMQFPAVLRAFREETDWLTCPNRSLSRPDRLTDRGTEGQKKRMHYPG